MNVLTWEHIMFHLRVCSTVLLIGIVACGESTTEAAPPEVPEPPPTPTVAPCSAGLVLSPGQSCSVSGINFSVRDDGSACLGGICSGQSITVNSFSAARIDGTTTWRINSL